MEVESWCGMTTRSSVQIPRRRNPYLTIIAGRLRLVYQQLDGKIELADACKCVMDFRRSYRATNPRCECCADIGFSVVRSPECPIDDHRLEALKAGAA